MIRHILRLSGHLAGTKSREISPRPRRCSENKLWRLSFRPTQREIGFGGSRFFLESRVGDTDGTDVASKCRCVVTGYLVLFQIISPLSACSASTNLCFVFVAKQRI